MGDYFDDLVRELAKYQVTVDSAYLHGLLTGYATIVTMDSGALFRTIAGEQPLAESVTEAVFDNIDSLVRELRENEFQARFDIDRDADAALWLDGYFEAVKIHEKNWEEKNQYHLEAGSYLMMLHTMRDAKLHRELQMAVPGPKDLKRNPQLITDMVCGIFQEFHADADGEFPSPYDESSLHPQIDAADISVMDETALMALVTSCGDLLPFTVVTECASRNDAMVPLLLRHLENDAHWNDDVDEGDWWALLHAVFILGLIPGEASARSLLVAFRRINLTDNHDLADWLAGSWPALCRNKREFTTAPLQQIAEDRSVPWYARSQAVDCVLADATERDAAALERAIDWLAEMCGSSDEDPEFRVSVGNSLLDFPRGRNRGVMDALVELQLPGSLLENAYTRDDIASAFLHGDNPEWQRFDNPWKFYDPDEIERRLQGLDEDFGDFDPGWSGPMNHGSTSTYQREAPKIGRNDPCH